jgi:hypothetical protein
VGTPIVTATPLPDRQGTRITFNNGGQDVKQLIADVLWAVWANHAADQVRLCTSLTAAQCRRWVTFTDMVGIVGWLMSALSR